MSFRCLIPPRLPALSLLGLAALLAVTGCGRPPGPLSQAALREQLLLMKGLDLSSETDRLNGVRRLKGLLEDQPDTLALLRELGPAWLQLPDLLASTALDSLRKGNPEEAEGLLELGLSLQPHHPLCNGIRGIEKAMRGQYGEARAYLEKADAWQLANPWIDHALGSLLLQSPRSADKARAKWLLKRVVTSSHEVLAPVAALLLLSNPALPIMGDEATPWIDQLENGGLLHGLTPAQLRSLSHRLARHSLPPSLRVGRVLWEHPEATLEDRLAIARGHLLIGNTAYAKAFMEEYAVPEAPEIGALPALLHVAEGEASAALERLRDQAGQLSTPDATILFRHLLPIAQIPISEEVALLEHGLLHEALDPPLRWALLSRLVSLRPLQVDRWAEFVRDTYAPAEPIEAARWLASVKRIEAALELLAAQRGDRRALLATAEIAVGRKDFAAAGLALAAYRALPGTAERLGQWHILMARCALGQEQEGAARQHWESARAEGQRTGDYALLKNLGILAVESGWPTLGRECLQLAYDAGIALSVPQLILLQELTLQQEGAEAALRVAASLHAQEPSNGEFLNTLAYLSFLSGNTGPALLDDLRLLVRREPDVTAYRLTLAFGTLQAGQQWEALRLLEQGNLDWQRLGNRSRLIYALVLQGADQGVLAAGMAASVERQRLIPEEVALLEGI